MSTDNNSTQALVVAVGQLRLVNYIRAASLALLAYDISIMFGLEFQYIWRAKWSLPKLLYLLARYYAFIFLALEFSVNTHLDLPLNVNIMKFLFYLTTGNWLTQFQFCQAYLGFYTIASIVAGTIVNAILTLRLNALYGNKKIVLIWLLAILIFDFIAELTISIVIAIHIQKTTYVVPLGIPLTGCFASAPTILTLIAWVPRLVASTIFFLMTLFKMFTSLANTQQTTLQSLRLQTKFSPLFVCFYTDGAIYYVVIASMVLVCAVTAVTLDGPLVIVATPALHAGYSLAVSRLIINLRCTALGQNASATWAETVSFQVLEPSNSSDSIGILLETLYYGHNDT
uniref:DUF6533 domain-containing protein n=1 Tax=Moniliophthora roreri TaxID=221103 RepID=A0A0W0GAI3_MONRR